MLYIFFKILKENSVRYQRVLNVKGQNFFSINFIINFFNLLFIKKSNHTFLLLSFAASGILFYELAKILKLKSLSLSIYWILSFLPVIFFYVAVSLDIFFLNDQLLI